METTFQLEFDEIINILFFKDVTNMDEIIKMIADNVNPFVNCAVINSQLILNPFQILIAANKTILDKHKKSLITKSLTTELLFNLSISENITASLNQFGYVSNSNNYLLLVMFESNSVLTQDVIKNVNGVLSPLSLLSEIQNLNLIKKIYDVTEEQLKNCTLLDLIVTKIACKSI
ncbi:hypothetical protein PGB90_010606 [Kerria lacca]